MYKRKKKKNEIVGELRLQHRLAYKFEGGTKVPIG
jgi:hypothetical protein